MNDLELTILGVALCAEPDDFLLRLFDLQPKLFLLAFFRAAAFVEQPGLALSRDPGIITAVEKNPGEHQGRSTVSFCTEAIAACGQLHQLGSDDADFRADLGCVKAQEHVAVVHAISVLDVDRGNDPAVAVLDLLDVALNHERAGRYHRARYLRHRRPSADANDERDHRRRSEHHVLDDRKIAALHRDRGGAIRCLVVCHLRTPLGKQASAIQVSCLGH